jgi:hypothetical protein
MTVVGIESIRDDVRQTSFFVKCIATKTIAVFFPGSIQHRDVKRDGVSYEDDYLGNALAATVVPGRIDFRYHRDYMDVDVWYLARALLAASGMEWAASYTVTYQGRPLI